MLDQLLKYFPKNTYPLINTHDPDRLLEDESVFNALVERGFTLVFEPDPIHLRYQIERLKPFSIEKPVIIRTEKALNELPYAFCVTISCNWSNSIIFKTTLLNC